MPIPDQNRSKHQHKGGWGRGFVAKLCHKLGVFICVIWSFFLLIEIIHLGTQIPEIETRIPDPTTSVGDP